MRTAVLMVLTCCPLLGLSGQEIPPSHAEVQGPTISPDAKSVVFAVVYPKPGEGLTSGPVVVLDLQTGSTKEILRPTYTVTREWTDLPAEIRLPRFEFRAPRAEAWYGFSWLPDSSAVFSTVSGQDGFTIWKLALQEDKAAMIRRLPEGLCQRPRVSPDAKWVVFYEATSHDLFSMQPNGEGLQRLTDSGDAYRLGYGWGPAGKFIYFSRGYMRKDGQCGIWKMNADGSDKTLILDGYFPRNLEVSPSGENIAFNLMTDGPGYDLFLYRIEEKKPVLIAENAAMFFSWHPRSETLFYVHKDVLYARAVPTASPQKLATGKIQFPVCTPDGKTILFLKGDRSSDGGVLWRLDVPSGKAEQIYPKP
jgi:Tol biopolymer transport system component